MTTNETPEVFKPYGNTGYQVSNYGRVIGKRGHILNPYTHKDTHRHVVSITDQKEEWGNRKVTVCRMVMETFGPPKPEGSDDVYFIDGDVSNLFVGNLTWSKGRLKCRRGHPLDGENVRMSGGFRNCRACNNAQNHASYERRAHGKVWDEARIQLESDDWYRRNVNV